MIAMTSYTSGNTEIEEALSIPGELYLFVHPAQQDDSGNIGVIAVREQVF